MCRGKYGMKSLHLSRPQLRVFSLSILFRLIRTMCCALVITSAAQAGDISRKPCFLPGMEDAVDCVTLLVPLDRAHPAGQKIAVFAAVLPALSRDSARDGLMLVPGGPGQSGDSLVPLATGPFRDIRQTRDIVLLYPRGTARSGPLVCPGLDSAASITSPEMAALANTCAARLKNGTVHFTATDIVADMEALRRALGYPQLSLWGGSFGSRIVQHFAREYPARTRLVILDAVAPAGVSIAQTAPRAAEAALRSLDAACMADRTCRTSTPSVARDVEALLKSFAVPRQVSMTDPVTGRTTRLTVDRQTLAGTIHLTLYHPQTRAMLPQLIAAAKQGRLEPLLAMSAATGAALDDQIAVGANFSALCAEDMQLGPSSVPPTGFMGDGQYGLLKNICGQWPHKKVPPRFLQKFASNVPALILSGALDPITPPEGGAIAASYFSNAVHVTLPASAHISSTYGCVPRRIAKFVEEGRTRAADWACTQKAKPPAPLGTPNG